MTTGPPIASPSTLAGLGASSRAASPTKIACSIIVAPRPPYSFGQEIPAQPAACSFNCHSRRKAITSSSPASGSGPGWFACSQARTSSRNSSSDGDSVRSIEKAAYTGSPGGPGEHLFGHRAVLDPVGDRQMVGFAEVFASPPVVAPGDVGLRFSLRFGDCPFDQLQHLFDLAVVTGRYTERLQLRDLPFESRHDRGRDELVFEGFASLRFVGNLTDLGDVPLDDLVLGLPADRICLAGELRLAQAVTGRTRSIPAPAPQQEQSHCAEADDRGGEPLVSHVDPF